MEKKFPDPMERNPVSLQNGESHLGTVFLKAAISHPRFKVGEYSYASAHVPPADWAQHLAPYLYDFSPEQLIIGKFCQIADGVQFITASANHRYDGISSFPFAIFGGGPVMGRPSIPAPGSDTTIGNDVWIGQGARILPGVRMGDGVIVGAGSVVAGIIPDYTIVVGNPGRVVRRRFSTQVAARLVALAWWDWPIERILQAEPFISGCDIDALETFAKQ